MLVDGLDEPPPTVTLSITGDCFAGAAVATGWSTVLSVFVVVGAVWSTTAAGTSVGIGRFNNASTFELLPIFVASLFEKMLINPMRAVTDKDAMIIFQPLDLPC